MRRATLSLFLALLTPAHAEEMGRLFFTPEQRLMLDNARRQKVKIEEKSEEQVPEIVSLNGVVRRSDGHTTVWLNNRAVSDRHTAGGVAIHPQGTASDPVTFMMPQGDRTVSLRVGQNLDVSTGQVVEPYHPRAAEMKRAISASPAEAKQTGKSDEPAISGGVPAVTLPDSKSVAKGVRAAASDGAAQAATSQPLKDKRVVPPTGSGVEPAPGRSPPRGHESSAPVP
jgi:hypothetical protein